MNLSKAAKTQAYRDNILLSSTSRGYDKIKMIEAEKIQFLLIIKIDILATNNWQGRKSFHFLGMFLPFLLPFVCFGISSKEKVDVIQYLSRAWSLKFIPIYPNAYIVYSFTFGSSETRKSLEGLNFILPISAYFPVSYLAFFGLFETWKGSSCLISASHFDGKKGGILHDLPKFNCYKFLWMEGAVLSGRSRLN